MSSETAAHRALESTFRSPSHNIKIEFQGGEPLLNFELIEEVVTAAEARNETDGKNLGFVIATNLALLDDRVLDFCRAARRLHLDLARRPGRPPQQEPSAARPQQLGAGHRGDPAGARGARRRPRLGADDDHPIEPRIGSSEIIDTYVEQGLTSMFLRPLSPYGFAIKTKSFDAYDVDRWLPFYEEGLDYIIELNAQGVPMVEQYAAIDPQEDADQRRPRLRRSDLAVRDRNRRHRLQLRR